MEASILIVEDDRQLAELLRDRLATEGFEIHLARDGAEGLVRLEQCRPDLVLLDVLMPRMDGWETCREMRRVSETPIIIVSCRSEDSDKVRGLELGADDYIAKPYSTIELVARIRAMLRRNRHSGATAGLTRIDDRLAMDHATYEVLVDGQTISLSGIEYKLLACLVENSGRILTHQSLLTQVWGWEYADQTDYLKVYIHHLRRKIEPDPQNPRYILTERGIGYRFEVQTPG
jgi:two-component system KDP operon response regulator KdpE